MKEWQYRVKYLEDGKERLTGLVKNRRQAKEICQQFCNQYGSAEVIDETAGEVWRYSDGKKTA